MPGSPTIASLFAAQRLVVGVGELAVANNPQAVLSTYALGSCIGIVAYDREAGAGGLLHLMLPDSQISPDKARRQPAMFADTGIPALFTAMQGVRAQRSRIRLVLAGAASVLSGPDSFRIGERNIAAVRRVLAVYGCTILASELGGTVNRTLHFSLSDARLQLKLPDRVSTIDMG
jgi:chemotaxis protein CheD